MYKCFETYFFKLQSKFTTIKQTRWKIAQWFEQKWWKNYLQGKSTADYIQWKKNYWHKFLQQINIDAEKICEPVIDIGCGPAGIFMIIEGENVTALDPLLSKYESELEIFKRENYPNKKFVECDFESFEPAEKFKTIFCINAINHFIDIHFSLEKLYHLTDKNGKLIVSIDTHNYGFFKYLFRLIPLDVLHPHQYNLQEYKQMLEKTGFVIKEEHCQQKAFFFNYIVLVAEKN